MCWLAIASQSCMTNHPRTQWFSLILTNLQAGWAHWAALLPSGSGTECLVGGSAPRVLVLGPREGGAAAPQDEPLLQWPKRKVS